MKRVWALSQVLDSCTDIHIWVNGRYMLEVLNELHERHSDISMI